MSYWGYILVGKGKVCPGTQWYVSVSHPGRVGLLRLEIMVWDEEALLDSLGNMVVRPRL